MKKLIQISVQFLFVAAVLYATFWLTFQLAIMVNEVSNYVWK